MDDVEVARLNVQHRQTRLAWAQHFGTLAHINKCAMNLMAAKWVLAHAEAREAGEDT